MMNNKNTIVVATTNKGKVREIKNILNEVFPNAEFKSLDELNCNIDVEEDKDTFAGNATKKAKELSNYFELPCISDDSGLCIDEYDGWPGVKTARFLGENKTDRERNIYILDKMNGLQKERRKAKCTTSIAFSEKGKETIVVEAYIDGYIADTLRGENGFGYDEIFEVEGVTLAEMKPEEKNEISARKKALILMREKIATSI